MKKYLIILEGIATSGKTTLLKNLEHILSSSYKVKVFTEDETLMMIVESRRFEVANTLMHDLLTKFRTAPVDIILTDRYHFTHIFRTRENLSSISELEDTLIESFSPHVFLLTIQEEKISERVQDARNRRDKWLGKEGTIEKKTKYYIDQQQKMRELARQSKIPVTEIDTTNMNWIEITDKIIKDSLIIRN